MMNFIAFWQEHGNEKSDTQKFWLELLRDVLGINNPEKYIEFEKRVELAHISFIDAYIPSTKIIIEQKSSEVSLDKAQAQSDGTIITPFEQAKRYYDWLPVSQRGRYIITCNFKELRVYDLETPKAPPKIIALENLELERANLAFIVKPERQLAPEVELSIKAGILAKKLRNELRDRYINPESDNSQKSLNIFCVRIVFLLYAEDSGLFAKSQFHDYLKARSKTARQSIIELFRILNQEKDQRDPYTDSDLKAFPFVNGGLFSDENIEIPQLDGEPLRIILDEMSEGFNWSRISPTIFGSVFESILRDEERHSGGIHYTSTENIHKVIDAFFLDELNDEFTRILSAKKDRDSKLRDFQEKLASLRFFDPACGSGNFLTETYISLCRLEHKIIDILEGQGGQGSFVFSQIRLSNFFGIETNAFAVAAAQTALWIAEIQMFRETHPTLRADEKILPLKDHANIHKANALLTNWHDILTPDNTLYIIGNPPYLGYSSQTKDQKTEITSLYRDEGGRPYKSSGKIDYIAGWFFKAGEFIHGTGAKAAFVATSSVTQGEQVSAIFRPLHERFGINIDFAHQPFIWENEAAEQAHVHVVIIGFDDREHRRRRLYTPEGLVTCDNINFYLASAPTVFSEPRSTPLQDNTPPARRGSQPTDGGNLIMTSEELDELLRDEPQALKFIRPFMMGRDFINRKHRYCLWLVGAKPGELTKCPRIMERIKRVKEFRLKSAKEATRRKAYTPYLFDEIVESKTSYIAIPVVSSEKRSYIPMDWLPPEVIPGNKLFIIPNASLYHFGVLTSRVHMAWVRRVAGRLEIDYSYGNTTVYNTFAYPSPTKKQLARIEGSARAILEARAMYPESSFADLYNDTVMPVELRRAHRENDDAVCEAYGWRRGLSEEEIVGRLFVMYDNLVGR